MGGDSILKFSRRLISMMTVSICDTGESERCQKRLDQLAKNEFVVDKRILPASVYAKFKDKITEAKVAWNLGMIV